MRRWPILLGLACLLGLTQASAEGVSVAPQTPKPQQARPPKPAKAAPAKTVSLGVVPLAELTAPPGLRKIKGLGLPEPERSVPVEPKGGFTIKAGRDSPDAPMTGGLMFRF